MDWEELRRRVEQIESPALRALGHVLYGALRGLMDLAESLASEAERRFFRAVERKDEGEGA